MYLYPNQGPMCVLVRNDNLWNVAPEIAGGHKNRAPDKNAPPIIPGYVVQPELVGQRAGPSAYLNNETPTPADSEEAQAQRSDTPSIAPL